MWPNVPGAGFPLCKAIVTLSFPIAIPPSNSNCFFNPSARSNHLALFFGSRTANPKWPTTPSVNGAFIIQIKVGNRKIKAVKADMTALTLILCAFIAATGVLMIVSPARANELTRLFADKAGLWVATAIRAGLGLGLLAAASESKAPVLLRILGLIILIVAIATPCHNSQPDLWIGLFRRRDQRLHCDPRPTARRSGGGLYKGEAREYNFGE